MGKNTGSVKIPPFSISGMLIHFLSLYSSKLFCSHCLTKNKTRCGETPPHCDDPAPPSHLRLLICQTHSLYPGGSGAGPAWPWATGAFPGYLPAANSLRSCQQVKQIWGCHCLYSGSHSSLARGPQTGSIHWGTVATVSQLAS